MSYKKIIASAMATLMISLSFAGCDDANNNNENDTTKVNTSISNIDISDMFTDRDKDISYDEASAVKITLGGNEIECDSSLVKIDESTATISGEGVFVVSGSLTNGQIVVDASDEKVQIVLKDANIKCADSAPIYVKNADKVFVTLANDSLNILTTSGEFESDGDTNVDGVIFAKDDITLNGNGILNINTENGHGIVCKNDLVIAGGTYNIDVSGHGLVGKDSIRIADGIINISAGEDAIHGKNDDEVNMGFVYIADGTFEIETGDDAIHSSAWLQIDNGNIDIVTSNEGLEGSSVVINGGNINVTATDDGINAAGDGQEVYIKISGGIVNVDARGDGLDSNGYIYISGGELYVMGPADNGNSSIDSEFGSEVTGGKVVAAGSSGMAQNFNDSSTQGSIMINLTGNTNGEIVLKDSEGNEFISYTPSREYSNVIISVPQIEADATYTIVTGTTETTVEMTSLIYGTGFGGPGGGPGGFNGEPPSDFEGGRPGGFNGEPPSDFNGERP